MRRTSRGLITGAVLLAAVAAAGALWARPVREVLKREVPLTTEERLDVRLYFGAGTLTLEEGRGDWLAKATLEYLEHGEAPEFSYRTHGRVGELKITAAETEGSDEHGFNIDIDDEEWDFGNNWGDLDRNEWRLSLTDRIPIALEIESGASKNDLDLTGLKISDLDLEVGACELRVTVDKPSEYRTRVISVDAGAARLRMEGLGNLNFERMEFNGGAGQFTLDFDGKLDHRATVEINLGVGQLNLFVPEDVGVKIDCSSCSISSVSVGGAFEEEDDVYVNDLYGRAEGEILFEVSASLATVNVETIR